MNNKSLQESKFTPGPWHVTSEGEIVSPFERIGLVYGKFSQPRGFEPNANLIASAPDLYTALEAWMRTDNSPASINAAVTLTNLALAKARGES